MPTDPTPTSPGPETGDGSHHSGYDPSTLQAVLGETAHLLRVLGFAAKHVVLIGGVVPSLLVLDPPGARHLGTTDIDLCLSVALTEGDTAQYERIEKSLVGAGFQPSDQSFRPKQSGRLGRVVEFFCPAGAGRTAGQLFRPKKADNPTAEHNMGGTLSALAIDAGSLISADTVTVQREVTLPDRRADDRRLHRLRSRRLPGRQDRRPVRPEQEQGRLRHCVNHRELARWTGCRGADHRLQSAVWNP